MELNFTEKQSEDGQIYYVAVESIEQINENEETYYQLIFDGVKKEEFEIYQNEVFNEVSDKVIPTLFVVKIEKTNFPTIKEFFKKALYKSKWFIINLIETESNLPVRVFEENFTNSNEEGISSFIASIQQINSNNLLSKKLNAFFSWKNYSMSTPQEILDELNKNSNLNNIHKLNIYNVGQGSLSAVTDDRNSPLFYFDLGGAWSVNRHTYPIANTLKLCFSKTKTIIISHWDLDHIETARRYLRTNPTLLHGITWIAPQQDITPYYFKIITKLNSFGTVLFWPNSLKLTLNFWAGKLIKCNGHFSDKNNSGLALIVTSPDNSIKNVLHPGDAAYMYIPNMKKFKLDGLVATHHGADFDINNNPIPTTHNGKIAYSHASCYGHPTHLSQTDHRSAGWVVSRETPAGHISFTTNLRNPNTRCNGRLCDLQLVQYF